METAPQCRTAASIHHSPGTRQRPAGDIPLCIPAAKILQKTSAIHHRHSERAWRSDKHCNRHHPGGVSQKWLSRLKKIFVSGKWLRGKYAAHINNTTENNREPSSNSHRYPSACHYFRAPCSCQVLHWGWRQAGRRGLPMWLTARSRRMNIWRSLIILS